MTEKFEREVLEKLDVMTKLLSQMSLDPEAPQTASITRLNKMGLKPTQIADILNTTSNYVHVILSQKRKAETNKNAKKENRQ